jgi:hypothetical protein
MSALATPYIHTTNTIDGVADPVNVEVCGSITKFDKPAVNGGTAEWQIIFKLRGDNASPNEVTWKYDTALARDTDYTAILTAVSTEM